VAVGVAAVWLAGWFAATIWLPGKFGLAFPTLARGITMGVWALVEDPAGVPISRAILMGIIHNIWFFWRLGLLLLTSWAALRAWRGDTWPGGRKLWWLLAAHGAMVLPLWCVLDRTRLLTLRAYLGPRPFRADWYEGWFTGGPGNFFPLEVHPLRFVPHLALALWVLWHTRSSRPASPR
jgi:hypothetical protein